MKCLASRCFIVGLSIFINVLVSSLWYTVSDGTLTRQSKMRKEKEDRSIIKDKQ